jgi:hypothetical protein
MLKRARYRTDGLGGNTGIERGGVELGVPEQDLDDADVDILLQQVRGEAVAQRVRGDPLADAGGLRSLMNGPVDLIPAPADRFGAMARPPLGTTAAAALITRIPYDGLTWAPERCGRETASRGAA